MGGILIDVKEGEKTSEFEKQNDKGMEWFKVHQEDLPDKDIFPMTFQ